MAFLKKTRRGIEVAGWGRGKLKAA